MQILVHERVWAAKRWMSWRNFHEYLIGTLWWLEGAATLLAFALPVLVMLSGAQTSTAPPALFVAVFAAMFATRLWGAKRLLRGQIRWTTAFALRVFRVPVGLACMWWLVSRKSLQFEVTPKGGADQRHRGRTPAVLYVLAVAITAVLVYSVAGMLGVVPWRTTPGSTVASDVWLLIAAGVLWYGTRRIRSADFATSRRNAYRVTMSSQVIVDDIGGTLVDISVGGLAVRFEHGQLPPVGLVRVELPGAAPIDGNLVRFGQHDDSDVASIRIAADDCNAYRALSLWMFHTPPEAQTRLPPHVPVIACTAA
jgi:cellulose synthase (UDP-forming)